MFKLNSKLKEVSCGVLELDSAFRELEAISESARKKYKDETEAIPATQFILSKKDKDFLRVECHSPNEIHFSSDRLIYDGGWLRRLFSNHQMQFRIPMEKVKSVLENYFILPRNEFEKLYSASYTHNSSLKYVEITE